MGKTPTYRIQPKFKGCIVGTKPPTYKRVGGGVFKLDDNLPQKDMAYLYEVIGLKTHIASEAPVEKSGPTATE